MSIYLYANAKLYPLFANRCTLTPYSTAGNLGYIALSNAGRSEHLVIYGGLQLGLAIAFLCWLELPPKHRQTSCSRSRSTARSFCIG